MTAPIADAYTLSAEAHTLERSVMRDLLKRASIPGVISLAGGLPDSALLPAADIADCVAAVLRREGGAALQYRPMFEPLRAWIADHMRRRGVDVQPENIFITSGNQQGLTILSRLFISPSDLAVTEAYTFTGVRQITQGRGARVIGVPVEPDGVELDALEAAFARQPSLAVLIPSYQNPLGVTLSDDKRRAVAELAARYRVPLVEDDPYSLLAFDGQPPRPIKAYDDEGWVFYLGSFSKMLAPGLRLGWIVAPPALGPRIVTLRESIDLESSALMQRAVHDYLARGLLPGHLRQLNAANRERCAAMLDALDTHFGGIADWTRPTGGLFAWLTLHDESIDTMAHLPDAIDQHGVAYVPGSAFSVEGGGSNTIRLNFSASTSEQIREGVARLRDVFA
ncbi:MAG: PLP-dependent aminotransferase family protein [Chloroflexi bacterium]|nr:PLP-dependent aminotransferase family protein [Chloroflexota bacterium]